jgi:hypothetical protein
MELAPGVAQQRTKTLQTARCFEPCNVTLVDDGPVISLPHENRIFSRAKRGANREALAQSAEQCALQGGSETRTTAVDRKQHLAKHPVARDFERFDVPATFQQKHRAGDEVDAGSVTPPLLELHAIFFLLGV